MLKRFPVRDDPEHMLQRPRPPGGGTQDRAGNFISVRQQVRAAEERAHAVAKEEDGYVRVLGAGPLVHRVLVANDFRPPPFRSEEAERRLLVDRPTMAAMIMYTAIPAAAQAAAQAAANGA
jgi:hypothetical protein